MSRVKLLPTPLFTNKEAINGSYGLDRPRIAPN